MGGSGGGERTRVRTLEIKYVTGPAKIGHVGS